MNTHQEIRDAIDKIRRAYPLNDAGGNTLDILHALNDRIERHEKENVALFKLVHEGFQKLHDCQP